MARPIQAAEPIAQDILHIERAAGVDEEALTVAAWIRWNGNPASGNARAVYVQNDTVASFDDYQFALRGSNNNRAVEFRLRTASGTTVAASGNVIIGEINGTASAKSVSGNVDVEIMQLSGAQDMDFGSVSGNVRVKLPAALDADVRMSTMSGGLKTDFPLTIEEPERGPGRRANGRIGGGSRQLKLSSVSGSVSLLRM